MAIRTRSPISPLLGHAPATQHHAIRTGSWLAPEALTDTARVRRLVAAFCMIAIVLTLAPFAAMAAGRGHTPAGSHGERSHLPKARPVPYPRLEWPLEISGSQYTPLAWTEIAGWGGGGHLFAYKAFRIRCGSVSRQRKPPADPK